ncbi:MAG: TlpA family protein disulfide reductase [Pontimonas sp.]|nr:TlpA family protein disulfide reductase [Pontimonas sp.]MDP4817094.1 TlpA family protein disulfide reductase [Pontimonas sp.]
MKAAFGGVLLIIGLVLSGCAAESDALAEQYRAGTGQNYISGDGALTVVAPESRDEGIAFQGPLDVGGTFSSDDYEGQIMVVNFWYAGCPPCRLEAPDLEALHQEFLDEAVVFIGVNILDQAPTALAFADEFGVTYPSIMDTNDGSVRLAFSGQVAPNAVPTTVVLDQQGRVAARISGLLTEPDVLAALIRDVQAEVTGS